MRKVINSVHWFFKDDYILGHLKMEKGPTIWDGRSMNSYLTHICMVFPFEPCLFFGGNCAVSWLFFMSCWLDNFTCMCPNFTCLSFSHDHESESWSNAIIIESLFLNCSEKVFDGYTIFCTSLAFIQVSVYDTS